MKYMSFNYIRCLFLAAFLLTFVVSIVNKEVTGLIGGGLGVLSIFREAVVAKLFILSQQSEERLRKIIHKYKLLNGELN